MQQRKKSACESKGHFWQPTSSPLVFRCGRSGCKAMQHCINGVWQETQPAQHKPAPVPTEHQMDLWA